MSRMNREIHMTGKDLMTMVQLRPEDIGDYALVPGPKERLMNLLKNFKDPVKNFSFMEYEMFTGRYKDIKVTAMNGGRFSADTAITTELLCNARAKHMIRIGSCGALQEDIKIGDVVVADSALRGEGVTPYYVDKDFQPEADQDMTQVLIDESKKNPLHKVHVGKVWSTDAILRETKDHVNNAIDRGAVAVDMVSSVFLTLANMYKIKASVILAVSDNIITGQMGFLDPNYYMAEAAIIKTVLNAVKMMEGK